MAQCKYSEGTILTQVFIPNLGDERDEDVSGFEFEERNERRQKLFEWTRTHKMLI